jgi:hypothetical protein
MRSISAIALLLTPLLLGCGPKESDYRPTPDAARTALTEALQGWTQGKKMNERAPDAKGPQHNCVDFQWTAGKRLKSFSLLDENPTLMASTQMFRVRLELEGEQPQEVEYYVVGKGDFWIMRDRDYRTLGME